LVNRLEGIIGVEGAKKMLRTKMMALGRSC